MARIARIVAGTLIFLSTQADAAQANSTIQRTIRASALRGMAFLGAKRPDGTWYEKHGLEGVSVALCDATFKSCKTVASTDRAGRFDLKKHVNEGDVFYLKLLTPGICEDQDTVKIRRKAGEIAIDMTMGF